MVVAGFFTYAGFVAGHRIGDPDVNIQALLGVAYTMFIVIFWLALVKYAIHIHVFVVRGHFHIAEMRGVRFAILNGRIQSARQYLPIKGSSVWPFYSNAWYFIFAVVTLALSAFVFLFWCKVAGQEHEAYVATFIVFLLVVEFIARIARDFYLRSLFYRLNHFLGEKQFMELVGRSKEEMEKSNKTLIMFLRLLGVLFLVGAVGGAGWYVISKNGGDVQAEWGWVIFIVLWLIIRGLYEWAFTKETKKKVQIVLSFSNGTPLDSTSIK